MKDDFGRALAAGRQHTRGRRAQEAGRITGLVYSPSRGRRRGRVRGELSLAVIEPPVVGVDHDGVRGRTGPVGARRAAHRLSRRGRSTGADLPLHARSGRRTGHSNGVIRPTGRRTAPPGIRPGARACDGDRLLVGAPARGLRESGRRRTRRSASDSRRLGGGPARSPSPRAPARRGPPSGARRLRAEPARRSGATSAPRVRPPRSSRSSRTERAAGRRVEHARHRGVPARGDGFGLRRLAGRHRRPSSWVGAPGRARARTDGCTGSTPMDASSSWSEPDPGMDPDETEGGILAARLRLLGRSGGERRPSRGGRHAHPRLR